MHIDKAIAQLVRVALLDPDPLSVTRRVEGAMLRAALEASGWSINGAARRLGKNPSSVDYAMRRRHPELIEEASRWGPGWPGKK